MLAKGWSTKSYQDLLKNLGGGGGFLATHPGSQGGGGGFLATHPGSQERIKLLQKLEGKP